MTSAALMGGVNIKDPGEDAVQPWWFEEKRSTEAAK